jgi:hypothetical protein
MARMSVLEQAYIFTQRSEWTLELTALATTDDKWQVLRQAS